MASLLAGAGIITLALGFAFQDTSPSSGRSGRGTVRTLDFAKVGGETLSEVLEEVGASASYPRRSRT